MPMYLIAFENHEDRKSDLHKLLVEWEAQQLLGSAWLAQVSDNARTVMQALQRASDQDAAFAVIELKRGAKWALSENVYGRGYDWLLSHL